MSHILWLKAAKFQQPLLITLGIADENRIGLKLYTEFLESDQNNKTFVKALKNLDEIKKGNRKTVQVKLTSQ